MKIVVYPHAMELGGSQLNAIELAAAVRDLGHDVRILSDEGALLERVADLGLERWALPPRRRRPSPVVAHQLRTMARASGLDVLHGYEWPAGVEVGTAARGLPGVASVCTVMSMAVAPFLPSSQSLVVGTQALQESAQRTRRGPVHLIEPPVDLDANAPGHPTAAFRRQFGLAERHDDAGRGPVVDIGVVCRLVPALKLEGVLTAIDVVGELATTRAVRLVVVGDGPSRPEVQQRAAAANQRAGRDVVVLTGELTDPRPAYAAMDVMLGMGGSALRSLAFGKPLVVQGELGFWELLTPATVDTFLGQGWYGLGDGRDGAPVLRAALLRLVDDAALREELSTYGRQLAVSRFGLRAAAVRQEQIYRDALAARPSGTRTDRAELLATAAGVVRHKVREKVARLRGVGDSEDFNAVARPTGAPAGPA